MSYPNFKTQINNIRKEAIKLGYSVSTMNDYQNIWNNFIKWKNYDNFIYDEKEYTKFLLDYYKFDINTYTTNSKSRHLQYMRSKRILDNFDEYKQKMKKEMFPKSQYLDYPKKWNITIDNYLIYCKEVKQNSDNTIKSKRDYLERELSYFYQKGMKQLSAFSTNHLNMFLNDTIKAGKISKRRNFYVLKDFLSYLFIENIINKDLSAYIPKIKNIRRKKIPTYINQTKVEELLSIIPKEKSIEKRDYAIILIAARLGLRISEILNIKLKDIDWKNNKLIVFQQKNNNLNKLPLTKEIGWSVIEYIKVRPKCKNEYLFIKNRYPFEKMLRFNNFNKYFDKIDLDINGNQKKGIHNLRHSLAKNLLDNDIPLPIIASTLGDTLETVSNTYLKIDIKNLKKCTLEVDE